VDYTQFLREVQRGGCFNSAEETEALVASVLMALAEVLPDEQLRALAAQVPPEAMVYLRRTGSQPDPLFDRQLFLGWVVSTVDATASRDKTIGGLDLTAAYSGQEAIRRLQCVFSVLKREMEDSLQRAMASALPEEVDGWFLNA
jgi:uncharacterized protein (DUF2267 family)